MNVVMIFLANLTYTNAQTFMRDNKFWWLTSFNLTQSWRQRDIGPLISYQDTSSKSISSSPQKCCPHSKLYLLSVSARCPVTIPGVSRARSRWWAWWGAPPTWRATWPRPPSRTRWPTYLCSNKSLVYDHNPRIVSSTVTLFRFTWCSGSRMETLYPSTVTTLGSSPRRDGQRTRCSERERPSETQSVPPSWGLTDWKGRMQVCDWMCIDCSSSDHFQENTRAVLISALAPQWRGPRCWRWWSRAASPWWSLTRGSRWWAVWGLTS